MRSPTLRVRHVAVLMFTDVKGFEYNPEWLWQSVPDVGMAPFTSVESVTAVRLRLCATGPNEPAVSVRCGVLLLDASAAHALYCANVIVGHNDVCDELQAAARLCDKRD